MKKIDNQSFVIRIKPSYEVLVRGYFSAKIHLVNGHLQVELVKIVVEEIEQIYENHERHLTTRYHGENFQYLRSKYWKQIFDKIEEEIITQCNTTSENLRLDSPCFK